MAKPNPYKVDSHIANIAMRKADNRKSVYSECVRSSFKLTGSLAPGFDNKDLQAWIDLYHPEVFDDKGKKR